MTENNISPVDANRDKEVTYHRINHSFKSEIIVPVAAISNNIDFLVNDKNATRMVKTSDNVECVVDGFEEAHICTLENDIKKMYGMEPWSYIMRWFKVVPSMYSMEFLKIRLKKYEK
jgi:hypothetical protein